MAIGGLVAVTWWIGIISDRLDHRTRRRLPSSMVFRARCQAEALDELLNKKHILL